MSEQLEGAGRSIRYATVGPACCYRLQVSSNTRVAPGGLRELGIVNWIVWRVLSHTAGTEDAHLFSTLGRTGGLFRGWLHYSGKLMPGGTLPRHECELVILRVAHLRQCGYEWDHHRILGKRAGVTPELLTRIEAGPTAAGWSDKHRALLVAVDQLVATKAVDDEAWAKLAAHYDQRRLIELVLLVTQYDGLATTIGALGIARDNLPLPKQGELKPRRGDRQVRGAAP